MASIKGITIKIAGDTSELTKSLESVNKKLKDTQSQLKVVDKALKLDPKNVQALEQKQKLLNDAIAETKEKLALEKEAAEKAKESLELGEISQSEYDDLQNEITLTSSSLADLERQAKQTSDTLNSSNGFSEAGRKLEEVGGKVSDVGDKMKEFGDNMTKYVTGPIVAAGGLAIASFQEIDSAVDGIIAATGASGSELEEYQGIMENIAETIPTTFETASDAVGAVATRFGLAGDDLETLATQFVEFSDLNETDVVSSVNDVQSMMAAFGVSADQTGQVLDYMNAVGQSSGISMSNLASLVGDNAETFDQMGMSMSDAMSFLGQVEVSGADTSAVMSGLRRALTNASEAGVPLDEALSNLQTTIQNSDSDMEAYNETVDLFGSKSAGAIQNAIENGTLAFDDWNTALSDNAGNLESTYEGTLDPIDEVTTTMNQLKDTMGDIGDSLATTLVPVLEQVNGALEELDSWWNSLDEDQQSNILTAIGVVAALGPVLSVIGSLVGFIGSIITAAGSMTAIIGGAGGASAAFSALGAVLAPVGLVIAAVTLAITAVVFIVKTVIAVVENWDLICWQLKQDFGEIWSGIQEVWNNLVDAISEGIDNAVEWFGSLGETISDVFGSIGDWFSDLIDSATGWASDMIDNFVGGIRDGISSVGSAASDMAGAVADFMHFSEPDKGPLSNFHTFAPDMVDLFSQGIEDSLPQLQSSVDLMASTVSAGTSPDYSGALSGISGQLSAFGSQMVVPVYIGNQLLGTAMAQANARNNLISGGR